MSQTPHGDINYVRSWREFFSEIRVLLHMWPHGMIYLWDRCDINRDVTNTSQRLCVCEIILWVFLWAHCDIVLVTSQHDAPVRSLWCRWGCHKHFSVTSPMWDHYMSFLWAHCEIVLVTSQHDVFVRSLWCKWRCHKYLAVTSPTWDHGLSF